MARIVIRESDLTTPALSGNSNEVVYVPGFATNQSGYAGTAIKGVPVLCTTVSEFNTYFGTIPAVFNGTQNYPESFSSDARTTSNIMFSSLSVDPSYVYAKELIQAGIPVLYERLNDINEDASVAKFYEVIQGTGDYDPILNLEDMNDYNIKYITTGGYPSFEYEYSLNAKAELIKQADSQLTGCTITSATFVNQVGQKEGLYDFLYVTPTTKTANASTESQTITAVTVIPDTFLNKESEIANYTFTAAVSGSPAVTTWSLNGETVDIAEYGISFEGTASNADTIVVSVRFEDPHWELNGEIVVPDDYGIDLTGTPVANDIISVEVTLNTATSIVGKMLAVAKLRGDCVALIDHTDNPERPLAASNVKSVYASVSGTPQVSPYAITSGGEYAAMFTPWYRASFVTSSAPSSTVSIAFADGSHVSAAQITWAPGSMPGSFGYLMALADSVRNNPSWLAVAGVTRGVVPNLLALDLNNRLTNSIADSYQQEDKISINPITNIRPYGYTIWGNRTLKNNAATNGLTATSFLNIRNMVSDIKKRAYSAAMSCIFEQNTDILWLNFKAQVEPVLEQMTSGYGINDYKIIREKSDSPVKIVATIRIYPVYAVESFDITIELANDVVSVEE